MNLSQVKQLSNRERYQRAFDFCAHCLDDFSLFDDMAVLASDIDRFREIRRAYAADSMGAPVTECHWCQHDTPPSHKGKSLADMAASDDYLVKGADDDWDAYDSQPYVVIDDVNPTTPTESCHRLKAWCSHSFKARVLGKDRYIRVRNLIVFSRYSMKDCFERDTIGLLEPLYHHMKIDTSQIGHASETYCHTALRDTGDTN